MGSNLVPNAVSALTTENVKSIVGWTNSTVVLCLLNQSKNYEPFVAKRKSKIKQSDYIKWQYVPIKKNPAAIRSKSFTIKALISKLLSVWLEVPSWLTNTSEWPNQPIIQPSLESQKEVKLEKQIVLNTTEIAKAFVKVLEKYELHKRTESISLRK